jgi:MFS family permease
MVHLIVRASSNRRGISMGLIGAGLGLVTALIGGLAYGFLAVGIWWIVSSIPLPGQKSSDGKRPQFPWLLLLPLPVWGVVALGFVRPIYQAEKAQALLDADPRLIELHVDEQSLSSDRTTGDPVICDSVAKAIKPFIGSSANEDVHVLVNHNQDNVLVLIMLPTLSQLPEQSRDKLLGAVMSGISENESHVFIGIKGNLLFGAVQTPPDVRHIGQFVSEQTLLPFYAPEAPPLLTRDIR